MDEQEGKEASEKLTEVSCPTPTAHRRLEEAHHFWHGCLDSYDNLTGFRTNLNACIQALRNVTFVLQKEKRLIEGFDNWYPKWQERMRADPLMRWLLQSRNRIVKEGDLEIYSTAKVNLVLTYFDLSEQGSEPKPAPSEATTREATLPPRYTSKDFADWVRRLKLPEGLLEGATLTVERRWVDRQLPDYELLEALARCYGLLSQLIDDAHRLVGATVEVAIKTPHGPIPYTVSRDGSGRLPCMVVTRDLRTTAFRLADGSLTLGGKHWSYVPDEDLARRSLKRYGVPPLPEKRPESVLDYAEPYMDTAKVILRRDGHHGWFVCFFHGNVQVDAQALLANHRSDKYMLATSIAHLVERNRYDGVAVIADSWVSPLRLDDEGVPIPAAEAPDREEGLFVHVENSQGQARQLTARYHRGRWRKIMLEDTYENPNPQDYNFLVPVREVWSRWAREQATTTDAD